MTLVVDKAISIPLPETRIWSPGARQEMERDTLFLLDPDYEQTLTPGVSGLTGAAYFDSMLGWVMDDLWDVSSYIQIVPGKHRNGIQAVGTPANNRGWLYMPDAHVTPDQFTIEFWVKGDADWSGNGVATFLSLSGPTQALMSIGSNGSTVNVTWHHDQDSSGVTNRTMSYDTHGLADQWINLALTYSTDDKLTLYRDGAQVSQITAVTQPQKLVSSGGAFQAAFQLLSGTGAGQTHYAISDLRISHTCRTPGVAVSTDHRSALTVTSTPTGTLEKNNLGVVHGLGSAAAIALADGKLNVGRTDKFLVATPIKVGGTDATHPTLGHSGAYSYDWQVVDRSMRYLIDTLGLAPYISINATPQVLGGSVAPYSGTNLTTRNASASQFPNDHPNDYTEWAKVVGDLVYHVTEEMGWDVPYWGVWNEPDLNAFWSGSNDSDRLTNYLDLYDATANAVKGINPALKVGGPEVSGFQAKNWVQTLIQHCQANTIPLDFISWHWYSGDIAEPLTMRSLVDYWRNLYSFTDELELIVGEWAWTLGAQAVPPWIDLHINTRDHSAAYFAQALIQLQNANVVKAFVFDADNETQGLVRDGALIYPAGVYKHPTLNVFEQWQMMSDTVVSHTLTGPPWLDAICTKNGSTYDVFLACLKYRRIVDEEVVITVPVADGTPVTVYVVDDEHSNYTDAGADHEDLESYDGGTVEDGSVTVTVRPRSACLVRIG